MIAKGGVVGAPEQLQQQRSRLDEGGRLLLHLRLCAQRTRCHSSAAGSSAPSSPPDGTRPPSPRARLPRAGCPNPVMRSRPRGCGLGGATHTTTNHAVGGCPVADCHPQSRLHPWATGRKKCCRRVMSSAPARVSRALMILVLSTVGWLTCVPSPSTRGANRSLRVWVLS